MTESGSGSLIVGLLIGLIFFALGFAETFLFYLAGLVGAGFSTIIASSLLIEEDRVSINNIFLAIATFIVIAVYARRWLNRRRPAEISDGVTRSDSPGGAGYPPRSRNRSRISESLSPRMMSFTTGGCVA